MRYVLLSSPLLCHHLREPFEQIQRVMRARGCLRVILHRKGRQPFVGQAFDCLVIQVYVADRDFVRIQCVRIDDKTVIL